MGSPELERPAPSGCVVSGAAVRYPPSGTVPRLSDFTSIALRNASRKSGGNKKFTFAPRAGGSGLPGHGGFAGRRRIGAGWTRRIRRAEMDRDGSGTAARRDGNVLPVPISLSGPPFSPARAAFFPERGILFLVLAENPYYNVPAKQEETGGRSPETGSVSVSASAEGSVSPGFPFEPEAERLRVKELTT